MDEPVLPVELQALVIFVKTANFLMDQATIRRLSIKLDIIQMFDDLISQTTQMLGRERNESA